MLLPESLAERRVVYLNLAREVSRSRDDRRERNRAARAWMLTGSQTSEQARFNKLLSGFLRSTSYLYTPEGVRWGIKLDPRYGDKWLEEEEAAREQFQDLFIDSGAGLTFGAGVLFSHAYDSVVFKVLVERNRPTLELVPDPSDVCVLRETDWRWDRQEVVAHFYEMGLSAYARYVGAIPDERVRQSMLAEAREHAGPSQQSAGAFTLPPTVERIILASASPTAVGNARGYTDAMMYQARDAEDVVRMVELWVYDDRAIPLCDRCNDPELVPKHRAGHDLFDHRFAEGRNFEGDYRVATHFLPTERTLWDPVNPLEPGRHPFHGLTLNPMPHYIWGLAPLWALTALQAWREQRMNDVDELLGKQVDPPIVATGISGIQDEKLKVLRRRGGTFTNPMPGGKVEPFVVPMPADAFAEIKEIDAMFAEQLGLPLAMDGTAQPGVRSADQAMAQASLGAGPTMTRAMLVERCLAAIGTSMLRLQRRVSRTPLRTLSGGEFLLSQMPAEISAVVDAHSASPIYTQQLAEKAMVAHAAEAIDGADLVRLLNLPQSDRLAAKQRKLQQVKATIAKVEMELKVKEVEAKMKAADAKMLQAQTP